MRVRTLGLRNAILWTCFIFLASGCADEIVDEDHADNAGEQNDLEGVEAPQAPTGLVASSGEYSDHIYVEWNGVEGADHYRVIRDGESIATVDGVSFDDQEATGGDVPAPPVSFEASQGEFTDVVTLGWDQPEVADGPVHTYEVIASNEAGDSEKSDSDDGYRAGFPVESYQLEIDGDDWFGIGDQTSYQDTGVDSPEANFDSISATQGEFVDHVLLEVDGLGGQPGDASDYRVRAVNDAGPGEATEEQQGYADAGELDIQWQRSAGESNGEFSDIPAATTQTYQDFEAPSDASIRYYRIVFDGAKGPKDESSFSESVAGFRLAPVDWFDRDELEFYVGDTGQAQLVDNPVKEGPSALETDGNNEVILSYEGDGLEHYPGPGDDFYVWIRSDFSETSFEGPHIYWGPGQGGAQRPEFQTRIRQGDIYLRGPGDCEDTADENLDEDTWYRLEIATGSDGTVDKAVYDVDGQLEYSMSIDCDMSDSTGDQTGIGFRAGGFGTTWYDHWTMTQLGL